MSNNGELSFYNCFNRLFDNANYYSGIGRFAYTPFDIFMRSLKHSSRMMTCFDTRKYNCVQVTYQPPSGKGFQYKPPTQENFQKKLSLKNFDSRKISKTVSEKKIEHRYQMDVEKYSGIYPRIWVRKFDCHDDARCCSTPDNTNKNSETCNESTLSLIDKNGIISLDNYDMQNDIAKDPLFIWKIKVKILTDIKKRMLQCGLDTSAFNIPNI
ncbi:unnamed protein product [Gordionus sp. m RMFG-2023]